MVPVAATTSPRLEGSRLSVYSALWAAISAGISGRAAGAAACNCGVRHSKAAETATRQADLARIGCLRKVCQVIYGPNDLKACVRGGARMPREDRCASLRVPAIHVLAKALIARRHAFGRGILEMQRQAGMHDRVDGVRGHRGLGKALQDQLQLAGIVRDVADRE